MARRVCWGWGREERGSGKGMNSCGGILGLEEGGVARG